MEIILGIFGYYVIGCVCWILAMHIEIKLNLFLEHDTWIILTWPVSVPVGVLYLLHRVRNPLIGKKPHEDKRGKEPENKHGSDSLYDYLLSEGVNSRDAAVIAKEMEEYEPGYRYKKEGDTGSVPVSRIGVGPMKNANFAEHFKIGCI